MTTSERPLKMTTIAERRLRPPDSDGPVVDVEIVVPVFNEEDDLEASVRRLDVYLTQHFPFTAVITIADNASTDATWQHATALASELPRVRAVHLDAKGRGRALHQVWAASTASVVAYMDVDLSTDLNALLPLVAPLLSGHSDVAIGSRLTRSARGDARTQARVHLPLLQPAAAHHAAHPVLRRPVRLQGDACRLRPHPSAACAGHVLVLRHRTARARRAQWVAHRRGACRLGRRSR